MTNHPHRSRVKNWPNYLRTFRSKQDLTRQQLADKLDVSLRNVEDIEQGVTVPMHYLRRALRDLERELREVR